MIHSKKIKVVIGIVLIVILFQSLPFLNDLKVWFLEKEPQQLPPAGLLVPTGASHPFGFERKDKLGDYISFTGTSAYKWGMTFYGAGTSQNLVGYNWNYARTPHKGNAFSPNTLRFEELTEETQIFNYDQARKDAFKSPGPFPYFREFIYNGRHGFILVNIALAHSAYSLFWDDEGKLFSIRLHIYDGMSMDDESFLSILTTLRRSNGDHLAKEKISNTPPVFTTEKMTNPGLLLKLEALNK